MGDIIATDSAVGLAAGVYLKGIAYLSSSNFKVTCSISGAVNGYGFFLGSALTLSVVEVDVTVTATGSPAGTAAIFLDVEAMSPGIFEDFSCTADDNLGICALNEGRILFQSTTSPLQISDSDIRYKSTCPTGVEFLIIADGWSMKNTDIFSNTGVEMGDSSMVTMESVSIEVMTMFNATFDNSVLCTMEVSNLGGPGDAGAFVVLGGEIQKMTLDYGLKPWGDTIIINSTVLYSTFISVTSVTPGWFSGLNGCFNEMFAGTTSLGPPIFSNCPVIQGCGCDFAGVVTSCLYPGCDLKDIAFDGSNWESITFGEGCDILTLENVTINDLKELADVRFEAISKISYEIGKFEGSGPSFSQFTLDSVLISLSQISVDVNARIVFEINGTGSLVETIPLTLNEWNVVSSSLEFDINILGDVDSSMDNEVFFLSATSFTIEGSAVNFKIAANGTVQTSISPSEIGGVQLKTWNVSSTNFTLDSVTRFSGWGDPLMGGSSDFYGFLIEDCLFEDSRLNSWRIEVSGEGDAPTLSAKGISMGLALVSSSLSDCVLNDFCVLTGAKGVVGVDLTSLVAINSTLDNLEVTVDGSISGGGGEMVGISGFSLSNSQVEFSAFMFGDLFCDASSVSCRGISFGK